MLLFLFRMSNTGQGLLFFIKICVTKYVVFMFKIKLSNEIFKINTFFNNIIKKNIFVEEYFKI